MRLFIGIPLADEVVDVLERLSRSLQSGHDNLRWSSSETWHITLQFLGETSAEEYGCLVPQLVEIRLPMVPVWMSGTGFFERAGVFFAGVNVSPGLQRLEKQVAAATKRCGFQADERPYHPHVTLARAKGDDRIDVLQKLKNRVRSNVELPSFTATEFLLYQAFLGPGGSRYEVRERFPLGNG
jgi:2'-5' RNA ligase